MTIIGITDRPPLAPLSLDRQNPGPDAGPDVVVSLAALGGTTGIPRHLRRRRRRAPWLLAVLAVLALSVSFLVQATRSVPTASFSSDRLAAVTIPGAAPSIPWPSAGESAMSIPATGTLISSGAEAAAPIASLTKVMTGYIVLRDHPIAANAQGPAIVMTADDQQDSANDALVNATSIPVVTGQSFTERQLLDGLIVHSANDFADSLARYDAGSISAFVAKMNATAAVLGMTQTHYTDPSGIDSGDVSTASDQLRLADQAMALPAFAAVAAQPAVTFAGVGILANYLPAVGTDGVVGVKSGFTQAAMGCVVVAAERTVQGRPTLFLAAVTGQQGGYDPIRTAQAQAIAIIDAAAPAVVSTTVLHRGQAVGEVNAPWSSEVHGVEAAGGLTILGWPGDTVHFTVQPDDLGRSLRAGAQVGMLVVTDTSRVTSVPIRITSAVTGPTWHWRFTRP